jgi:AcrR family transcriptional regulator
MPRRPSFDRDELIDRARDVFWERGWAGTSMKDLETALGLKPGSFYAAFGSKAKLYGLALERYVQNGQDSLAASVKELGALEALKQYPLRIVQSDGGGAKACMLAKTVLELQSQESELSQMASAALSQIQRTFAKMFAQAQADGDVGLNHDPARLARRYQSDLLGLRVSAERADVDAVAIAQEMAVDLDRLA